MMFYWISVCFHFKWLILAINSDSTVLDLTLMQVTHLQLEGSNVTRIDPQSYYQNSHTFHKRFPELDDKCNPGSWIRIYDYILALKCICPPDMRGRLVAGDCVANTFADNPHGKKELEAWGEYCN